MHPFRSTPSRSTPSIVPCAAIPIHSSSRSGLIAALLLLTSCAATPDPGAESAELEEMATQLERELAARASSITAARASSDPWDLWAACLETSAPEVLAARRELAMATARAQVAGVPETMLDVEHVGSGSERETELMLALDVPGLLGAGRAGAQRARARVDEERAHAQLAAARFKARHELERRLAALVIARQLEQEVTALEKSSQPNAKRLELLQQRGWIAPDAAAVTNAMLHHLGVVRLEQQAAVAAARADVAIAAGLPADSPWLDDPETTSLLMISQRTWGRAARPDPTTRELLACHPELSLARLDYVATEADVRIACAERWPALWIGPKAMWTADDLMLGGLVRLELPWPPTAGAAVDQARAGRDRSRESLGSALAAARSRIVERRATHRLMEQALREHGDDVLESSEQALRAAQARFAVDPAAVTEWGMAIDQRVRALVTQAGSMQRWLVATFDLSEALGPPPDDPARAADGGKTADAANPEARR